jgi:hypothetical protein
VSNYYAGKMAQLREEWGGRCVMCGSAWSFKMNSHGLEFAHLPGKKTPIEVGRQERGRGRADRYHDVRNHPECYVLLCVADHARLDGRGGRENGRCSEEQKEALW